MRKSVFFRRFAVTTYTGMEFFLRENFARTVNALTKSPRKKRTNMIHAKYNHGHGRMANPIFRS